MFVMEHSSIYLGNHGFISSIHLFSKQNRESINMAPQQTSSPYAHLLTCCSVLLLSLMRGLMFRPRATSSSSATFA